MLTLIIALLMNLGLITSAADYHNASSEQQEEYHQIVGTDIETM